MTSDLAMQLEGPDESGCEGTVCEDITGMPVVAIVGSPNVGKSVLFNSLTGRYVTVSNYPGTTVEVSRGRAKIEGAQFGIVDTPGMYSLSPITDEERVARRLLVGRAPAAVIHVVDAKNLERMLPLTVQLLELGLPLVLVLNMIDEADRLGLHIDAAGLSRDLGIPVVKACATSGRGVDEVRKAVLHLQRDRTACCAGLLPLPAAGNALPLRYDAAIEQAIEELQPDIPIRYSRAARGVSLLLLQNDSEMAGASAVNLGAPGRSPCGEERPVRHRIALARHAFARALARQHMSAPTGVRSTFAERLSDLTTNPLTGIPLFAAIVYFGLYELVGVFGAGYLVDSLQNQLFGRHIGPAFNAALEELLPGATGWQYWTRELFGGQYGLVTLGVAYAIAIILPIVSLFFLFFSLLEDSGYFPRLALLVDRVFKKIGLNGRAVIPLVLGLGCDTMATMVTRIQETKRERIITTLLLALAIPCSAQYGVITGLLAKRPAGALGLSYAWLAWAGLLLLIFLITGRLASRIIPGRPATFYMELPPLRMPRPGNVIIKTAARMKWYFFEVLPLFLFASALIWIGRLTGAFDALVHTLEPVVMLIGLPPAAAKAFLYGFFRRDFGAAGLYGMADGGQLTSSQLLVACVTLTLFVPCVAQFLVMKKERGLKTALAMSGGIVLVAFAVGGLVNVVLATTGPLP